MFIFIEHICKLTIEFLCLFEVRLSNTLSILPFQGWNTLGVFFLTMDVSIEVSGVCLNITNQVSHIQIVLLSCKYTGLPIRVSLVQIWLGEFNYLFFFFSFLFFDWIFVRVCIFVTRVAKHSSQTLILIRGITITTYFLVIVGGVLVLCNSAVPSFLGLTEAFWIATGRVWRVVFSVFSILFSSTRARLVLVKNMIFLAS